jgi:hypothetical protein
MNAAKCASPIGMSNIARSYDFGLDDRPNVFRDLKIAINKRRRKVYNVRKLRIFTQKR